jgi:hypothetical protein
MRRFLIGLLVCGAVWAFGTGIALPHDDERGDGQVDDQGHQGPPDLSALSRYGEWTWEPAHGRVWRPDVQADWRPYWRGHWARRGTWVWVSADPWGDGPFHYGEWVWSRQLGWVWIPGTVWAPGRVTWIVSGSVVAWAPAGIHVTVRSDPRAWVYADAQMFQGPIVRPHHVPPPHARLLNGLPMRDPWRVFVTESDREPRSRSGLRPDHRAAGPRFHSRLRAPHREAARGFDLRER